VPYLKILQHILLSVTYKACIATLVYFRQIVPGLQKHAPYPLAHRDNIPAKEYGHCPDGRRVTQTLLIAGPLAFRQGATEKDSYKLENSIKLDYIAI